ncbi:Hypothetical_protein [Hexamita inflata]|uniref:Hypothetical_protein n=1 Tax=Hexamita inflata TaxID=28002 RepID=A0AA86U2V1_9EUKA|nr:Hypothetical protein HINF_LOCUS16668 [Hexamita inflata]
MQEELIKFSQNCSKYARQNICALLRQINCPKLDIKLNLSWLDNQSEDFLDFVFQISKFSQLDVINFICSNKVSNQILESFQEELVQAMNYISLTDMLQYENYGYISSLLLQKVSETDLEALIPYVIARIELKDIDFINALLHKFNMNLIQSVLFEPLSILNNKNNLDILMNLIYPKPNVPICYPELVRNYDTFITVLDINANDAATVINAGFEINNTMEFNQEQLVKLLPLNINIIQNKFDENIKTFDKLDVLIQQQQTLPHYNYLMNSKPKLSKVLPECVLLQEMTRLRIFQQTSTQLSLILKVVELGKIEYSQFIGIPDENKQNLVLISIGDQKIGVEVKNQVITFDMAQFNSQVYQINFVFDNALDSFDLAIWINYNPVLLHRFQKVNAEFGTYIDLLPVRNLAISDFLYSQQVLPYAFLRYAWYKNLDVCGDFITGRQNIGIQTCFDCVYPKLLSLVCGDSKNTGDSMSYTYNMNEIQSNSGICSVASEIIRRSKLNSFLYVSSFNIQQRLSFDSVQICEIIDEFCQKFTNSTNNFENHEKLLTLVDHYQFNVDAGMVILRDILASKMFDGFIVNETERILRQEIAGVGYNFIFLETFAGFQVEEVTVQYLLNQSRRKTGPKCNVLVYSNQIKMDQVMCMQLFVDALSTNDPKVFEYFELIFLQLDNHMQRSLVINTLDKLVKDETHNNTTKYIINYALNFDSAYLVLLLSLNIQKITTIVIKKLLEHQLVQLQLNDKIVFSLKLKNLQIIQQILEMDDFSSLIEQQDIYEFILVNVLLTVSSDELETYLYLGLQKPEIILTIYKVFHSILQIYHKSKKMCFSDIFTQFLEQYQEELVQICADTIPSFMNAQHIQSTLSYIDTENESQISYLSLLYISLYCQLVLVMSQFLEEDDTFLYIRYHFKRLLNNYNNEQQTYISEQLLLHYKLNQRANLILYFIPFVNNQQDLYIEIQNIIVSNTLFFQSPINHQCIANEQITVSSDEWTISPYLRITNSHIFQVLLQFNVYDEEHQEQLYTQIQDQFISSLEQENSQIIVKFFLISVLLTNQNELFDIQQIIQVIRDNYKNDFNLVILDALCFGYKENYDEIIIELINSCKQPQNILFLSQQEVSSTLSNFLVTYLKKCKISIFEKPKFERQIQQDKIIIDDNMCNWLISSIQLEKVQKILHKIVKNADQILNEGFYLIYETPLPYTSNMQTSKEMVMRSYYVQGARALQELNSYFTPRECKKVRDLLLNPFDRVCSVQQAGMDVLIMNSTYIIQARYCQIRDTDVCNVNGVDFYIQAKENVDFNFFQYSFRCVGEYFTYLNDLVLEFQTEPVFKLIKLNDIIQIQLSEQVVEVYTEQSNIFISFPSVQINDERKNRFAKLEIPQQVDIQPVFHFASPKLQLYFIQQFLYFYSPVQFTLLPQKFDKIINSKTFNNEIEKTLSVLTQKFNEKYILKMMNVHAGIREAKEIKRPVIQSEWPVYEDSQ